MAYKGTRNIKKKEFEKIKALLNSKELKLSIKEIADFVKRGYTTVSIIKRFDTLKEYNQYNRERIVGLHKIKKTEKDKAQPTTHTPIVDELKTHTQELRQIKKILVETDTLLRGAKKRGVRLV